MKNFDLPQKVEAVFELADLDEILSALMKEIVKLLKCDRCFLYVREPQTRLGRVPFCYCGDGAIPDVSGGEWERESPTLERQDPMFAAALNCQPTIFVEDIETASPDTLNREFEREHFGHRALIHAHLCHQGQLWGVLQPAVFSAPRPWSDSEKLAIAAILKRTTPLVVKYVTREIELINQQN